MTRSLSAAFLALLLAPLLPGIISRVKAFFAGRRGQPLLQPYRDIVKLLRKGTVYSGTTTWLVKAGPVVGLATAAAALALVPFAGEPGLVSFAGDLILLAYLLGLGRFFTVLAALDTGSAFEGMGGSREAWFSTLAEPALLLGLAGLAAASGSLSLSGIFLGPKPHPLMGGHTPAAVLIAVAFVLVFLVENSRIPFDDPNTHLELTMIHEVMVLDHGGPDLALIEYGAALKLWVLGGLLVDAVLPPIGSWPVRLAASLAGLAAVALLTGVVESSMARLRLLRVPQALVMASVFSLIALILVLT